MPPTLASFKLRFADEHVRIVPLVDHEGCPFRGPGVDLRGEDARGALALAAPIVAWLVAREPVRVRSLSIDIGKRRILVTYVDPDGGDAQRPRVLRVDERFDAPSASALIELAAPLVARLAVLATAQLARRPKSPGSASTA